MTSASAIWLSLYLMIKNFHFVSYSWKIISRHWKCSSFEAPVLHKHGDVDAVYE